MPPKPFTAKLTDKMEYNERYMQMRFELIGHPNQIEWQAGQYVSLAVDDAGTRRSYSICSSPDIKHGFDLLIDTFPQGVGTNFLASMEYGHEVQGLAPLGRFVLAPDTKKHSNPVVVIATGSGIAPFKSMLHELLQIKQARLSQDPNSVQYPPRQITLHWGMRHAEHLFWLEEMQDFLGSFSNFHFNPILSQPTQEWTLSRGRVTDVLAVVDLPENADYYLCGSQAMIKDVGTLLISRGVLKEHIHHEAFY